MNLFFSVHASSQLLFQYDVKYNAKPITNARPIINVRHISNGRINARPIITGKPIAIIN